MRFLFVLPLLLSACTAPSLAQPTPNIGATVQSQVRATLTALPAATALPTATAVPKPTLEPTSAVRGLALGEEAWILAKTNSGDVAKYVDLARNWTDFDDYLKAVGGKDGFGILELEFADRLFPVASGVRVQIIELQPNITTLMRVRVMEGPKAPRAGWADTSWLVKQLPTDFQAPVD